MQKNSFEKFARIFSRRHKQTTFSDAVFLGALRVNLYGNVNLTRTSKKFRRLEGILLWDGRRSVHPSVTLFLVNEISKESLEFSS